jgi:transposase
MMGERLVMQESLLYEFRLEDHVPSAHLLRHIDRLIDCSELRQHLAGSSSSTGRPSIDPELMICMLLIGYCLGI